MRGNIDFTTVSYFHGNRKLQNGQNETYQ